jgi:hypothetical protein
MAPIFTMTFKSIHDIYRARSLAYASLVREKFLADPVGVRGSGLTCLHRWKGVWGAWYQAWEDILNEYSDEALTELLINTSERGDELRHNAWPFTCVMTPEERGKIFDEYAEILHRHKGLIHADGGVIK